MGTCSGSHLQHHIAVAIRLVSVVEFIQCEVWGGGIGLIRIYCPRYAGVGGGGVKAEMIGFLR